MAATEAQIAGQIYFAGGGMLLIAATWYLEQYHLTTVQAMIFAGICFVILFFATIYSSFK